MIRFVDPFYFNNFVDANILDDVADGANDAVREIVALVEAEEISLLLPYSVQQELSNPNTPPHVRQAATWFLFSCKVELTVAERRSPDNLVNVAKEDAKEKNIAPDLLHVWEAAKNGGGYFITRDKRLLARANAIASMLQINVVTPAIFLERVKEARELAVSFP